MKSLLSVILSLVLVLAGALAVVGSTIAPANAAVSAFPGAEGYGTDTTHGRNGTVIKVTNLNDSGTGSLRAALNASGPRIIVFTVGGTISLNSRLEINNPHVYVAGQSAPGGGITLRMNPSAGTDDGTMKIDTHDVLIRFIRFRPGDGGAADDSHDAISAYKQGGGSYNLVFDHNSFSWAVDENVNIYYDVEDVTFSNNIVSEALSNAGHPGGEHSKGMLSGGGSKFTSIHNNLFIHNVDRNPQISGVVNADIRNNVIYGYGDGSGSGVTLISSSKGEPVVNWVGNYYKPGPESPTSRAEFATYNGDTGATHTWYGNGNQRWTSSGDQAARVASGAVGQQSTEIPMAPVTTTSAAAAYTRVLANAGASKVRDAVDNRLVNDVQNRTGGFIDSPSEVGGWPTVAAGTAPTDSDGDGMPNAWETANGTNPNVADANGDADNDGWTNIEDYLSDLAGDEGGSTPPPPPPPVNQAPSVDAGANDTVQLPNSASLDGTVSDDGLPSGSSVSQEWTKVSGPGTVTFGNANNVDTTASFSQAGTYVLRLTATDGSLSNSDDVQITVLAEDEEPPPPPPPPTGETHLWTFDENTQGWTGNDVFGTRTVPEEIVSSDVRAYSGAKSMRVTWDDGAHSWVNLFEAIPLDEGDDVSATAKVWVPAGSPDVALEAWFTKLGEHSTTNGQWETVELDFEQAANGHLFFGIPADGPTESGDVVFVDNVRIDVNGGDGTPDPAPNQPPARVVTPSYTDNANPDDPCGTVSLTLSTGANDTHPSVFTIDYENAAGNDVIYEDVTVQPNDSVVWEKTFAEDYSNGMVDVNVWAEGSSLGQEETPTDCETEPPPAGASFVGSGGQYVSGSSASVSPTGLSNGDKVVFYVTENKGSGSSITAPGSVTALGAEVNDGSSLGGRLYTHTKGSTSPSSFQFSASGASEIKVSWVAYSGIDSISQVALVADTNEDAQHPVSGTTSAAGVNVVFAADRTYESNAQVSTWTLDNALTERRDAGGIKDGDNSSLSHGIGDTGTAVSAGSKTYSATASQASKYGLTGLVNLVPLQ